MALTLVTHADCPTALFGALAASVAWQDAAPLLHLPAHFAPADGADSAQMVAAAGALVPSGLVWYERLCGREILPPSSVESIVEAALLGAVVVAWHPRWQPESLLRRLLHQARAASLAIRRLNGQVEGDRWFLTDDSGQPTPYGRWYRDPCGRWSAEQSLQPAPAARPRLAIAVLGTDEDQRLVYPAGLAALGDAADALGIELDLRFIDPTAPGPAPLHAVGGLLLPGGSAMANVAGQIAAARHALAADIPTLGLCLGMQSMATAYVQGLPGFAQANMAEAAADAVLHSFVPMAGHPGLAAHRLGDQPLRIVQPSLAQRLRAHPTIRCNHRYMLNPSVRQAVLAAGLEITATNASGHIVDAIDVPSRRFFKGLQGHPELASRPAAPYPLFEDFLRAARAHAASTDETGTHIALSP
jgi:CTP synthase